MNEDFDWKNPNVVIGLISDVIWPSSLDDGYDVFDDVEHITWILNNHYNAIQESD
jgi:hypothetical protein